MIILLFPQKHQNPDGDIMYSAVYMFIWDDYLVLIIEMKSLIYQDSYCKTGTGLTPWSVFINKFQNLRGIVSGIDVWSLWLAETTQNCICICCNPRYFVYVYVMNWCMWHILLVTGFIQGILNYTYVQTEPWQGNILRMCTPFMGLFG